MKIEVEVDERDFEFLKWVIEIEGGTVEKFAAQILREGCITYQSSAEQLMKGEEITDELPEWMLMHNPYEVYVDPEKW